MHIRNIMYVRLIRGRVCFVFFLILKYIWYLCISRQKCNKNDRLVTNGTKTLCRWRFCVRKSLLSFFSAPEWMHISNVPSYCHSCIVCSLLIQKQQGGFHKWDIERWFYPVSHIYAKKAFSFSPNPKRCWKIFNLN